MAQVTVDVQELAHTPGGAMMLTMLVQSLMISRVQTEYRELGTLTGLQAAEGIMAVRKTFEQLARRFNERQTKAASNDKPFLPDGRQKTLQDQLFGPLAGLGWPTQAAAALHGLKLNTSRPIHRLDPHSYLAKIQVGPDQARSFGAYCGIAIYFDPLNSMDIAWVGPEVDLNKGWQTLDTQTSGFKNWSRVRPEYQKRLDQMS
jgi:hypothetical protein